MRPHAHPSLHSVIYSAMNSQDICTACATNFASGFCCCVFPVVLLCDECFSRHSGKAKGLTHTHFPLESRQCVASAGDAAEVRRRVFEANEAEARLKHSLLDFEHCEQQLTCAFSSVRSELDALQTRVMDELKLMKYQTEDRVNRYVAELRDRAVSMGKVQGEMQKEFSYYVETMDVVQNLQKCFALRLQNAQSTLKLPEEARPEEPSEEGNQTELPMLTSTSLRFFDCNLQRWGQETALSLPIEVDPSSPVVLFQSGELLCVGGFYPVTLPKTYLVSREGGVRGTASPAIPRIDFGAAGVGTSAYAFGGHTELGEVLQSAEVFSLANQTWKPLGDMLTARSNFVPCVHSSRIFLCSSGACEAFDTATSLFQSLPVSLPTASVRTIAAMSCNTLVIAQENTVFRWQMGTRAAVREERSVEDSGEWKNTNAVVTNGAIYLLTTRRVVALTGSKQ